MTYSVHWLTACEEQTRLKFLYFWGHRPSRDGSVTASCLSQWWNSPFNVGAERYRTSEHWMMTSKARLFGDSAIAAAILAAENPAEAKKLGRMVRGFVPDVWDEAKVRLVVEGNIAKFSQHDELRRFLLDTGDRVLVEASPVDAIWGIGFAADDPRSLHPGQWRGENLLGFALMEVRDRLRGQSVGSKG